MKTNLVAHLKNTRTLRFFYVQNVSEGFVEVVKVEHAVRLVMLYWCGCAVDAPSYGLQSEDGTSSLTSLPESSNATQNSSSYPYPHTPYTHTHICNESVYQQAGESVQQNSSWPRHLMGRQRMRPHRSPHRQKRQVWKKRSGQAAVLAPIPSGILTKLCSWRLGTAVGLEGGT